MKFSIKDFFILLCSECAYYVHVISFITFQGSVLFRAICNSISLRSNYLLFTVSSIKFCLLDRFLGNSDRVKLITNNCKTKSFHKNWVIYFYANLTLSWRRPLSHDGGRYHIETSPVLRSKSMDSFVYNNGLRHERVKLLFNF